MRNFVVHNFFSITLLINVNQGTYLYCGFLEVSWLHCEVTIILHFHWWEFWSCDMDVIIILSIISTGCPNKHGNSVTNSISSF